MKKRRSTTNQNKYDWYWGQNENQTNYCYLMEIIAESLDRENKYAEYKDFIKNNITKLCFEISNMSDFFTKLNQIILSQKTKKEKINEISNMRDESGKKFITKEVGKLIYNAMTMKYVHYNQNGGASGLEPNISENINETVSFKNAASKANNLRNINSDYKGKVNPLKNVINSKQMDQLPNSNPLLDIPNSNPLGNMGKYG